MCLFEEGARAVFTLKRLLGFLFNPDTYIWADVLLIKETQKAVLIEFDGRRSWLPKAWVLAVKQVTGRQVKIKISEYDWARKFE